MLYQIKIEITPDLKKNFIPVRSQAVQRNQRILDDDFEHCSKSLFSRNSQVYSPALLWATKPQNPKKEMRRKEQSDLLSNVYYNSARRNRPSKSFPPP